MSFFEKLVDFLKILISQISLYFANKKYADDKKALDEASKAFKENNDTSKYENLLR